MLKGNLIFGQSGGPSSVINSSAAGVFIEALRHDEIIDKIYGAHHGIVGILEEDFYDIGQEEPSELEFLKYTPSSALGSCRYKLKNVEEDDRDYRRLLDVFRKYNIRYFFYNGGNDSMDTCNKVSKYLRAHDYDCRVIGVPKTIDNDLAMTDHCPGFGSAARYIATTMMEIYCDANVYDKDQITVVEIMGRHAGWLTAAASLACLDGYGPDLIYVPERVFDMDRFLADVAEVKERQGKVIIAVSEGIHDASGQLIAEKYGDTKGTDSFGHKQLGGTAMILAEIIEQTFGVKVRGIEFSLMQRCAGHLASQTDINESFASGKEAVQAAIAGKSDIMIGFRRVRDWPYKIELCHIPLAEAANQEKKLPDHFINERGNGIEQAFVNYCLPLIQGAPETKIEYSLPRFCHLKFVQAGRL